MPAGTRLFGSFFALEFEATGVLTRDEADGCLYKVYTQQSTHLVEIQCVQPSVA